MTTSGATGHAAALGPGREFDRIRRIVAALGAHAGPLGDDCAVLSFPGGTVVASTDVSVEGVHFRREWLLLEEIGWRAAVSALSDLAAAGADAHGLLVALTVPAAASDDDVVAAMKGAGAAAAEAGTRIVGGDLSAGAAWSLAVTVLGSATVPISRTGVREGDGLWITGVLGGPRAALEAWRRGDLPGDTARRAFARPAARLQAGRWLARHGAVAMIDLSDGLGADATHLAAASGVAVVLDLERVPVAEDVADEARRLGMPAEQFAAESGEEYELLVALPAEFGAEDARTFESACGIPLTRVGEARAGAGVRAELRGRRVTLAGYDHFAARRR
ncbi:MAG TPA: thiamine-phosphate kinase [Gemmatimonadales bacterium]|nr:thiamine-phosphate kinase [Gemmatimonadales bacterium]